MIRSLRPALLALLCISLSTLTPITEARSFKNPFTLPALVSNTGVSEKQQANPDRRSEVRQLCEAHGSPPSNYSNIDVVVVMVAPVCVTQQTIKLLRYNFNFRHLYYIVKHVEFCPYLLSIDDSVRCVDENTVLPGVSYKALQDVSGDIKKNQGIHNRVGWYLQQYLKLGVALHLPDLSDHYLIWDADNIPIKPFDMFGNNGEVKFCANPSSAKAKGYGKFYKMITGQERSQLQLKGKIFNFVCGYMMFYRPYVKEMLDFMDAYIAKTVKHPLASKGFPWSIHAVANEAIKQNVFFSEYDSYGSWVMKHHPDAFEADYDISYIRNPKTLEGAVQDKFGAMHMQKTLQCCLRHKDICSLGKELSDGPHGKLGPKTGTHHHILIWEEHKFRYRTENFCEDGMPEALQTAVDKMGTGMNTNKKTQKAIKAPKG